MDITELFDMVDRQRASDLLISAGAPPMLRIDGFITRTDEEPMTPAETQELVYQLLTPEQRQKF